MDIVVGIKQVPDSDTRLRVAPSGKTYDPDGVKFTIANTYDEATLEEALRIRETVGSGQVRAISVGPARAEEALRMTLAMGADEAILVETAPSEPGDPLLVSRALATVIRGIPHDLVMVGRQAADDEAGQVGSALGEYLDLPSYAFVSDLEVDPSSHRIRFHRYLEGGEEVLEGTFPAVLSILKGAHDPRTPTLPNILKARRKPLQRINWADLRPQLQKLPGGPLPTSQVRQFRLPPPRSGAKMIDYQTPEEAAQKLLKLLREEAKVL
jgi:electron transfer flavoprotein beta subunit